MPQITSDSGRLEITLVVSFPNPGQQGAIRATLAFCSTGLLTVLLPYAKYLCFRLSLSGIHSGSCVSPCSQCWSMCEVSGQRSFIDEQSPVANQFDLILAAPVPHYSAISAISLNITWITVVEQVFMSRAASQHGPLHGCTEYSHAANHAVSFLSLPTPAASSPGALITQFT